MVSGNPTPPRGARTILRLGTVMASQVIMSSHAGFTFMYRVGGILIHDDRLLVEWNAAGDFCFVPGGRVEYGETAPAALRREAREELGESVRVARLLAAADNIFVLDGRRYQEISLYFSIELDATSRLNARDGVSEGTEPGNRFEWIPAAALERARLMPPFLRGLVRDLPEAPVYIASNELDSAPP